MHKLIILFSILLLYFTTVEAVVITEIMYDPEGKDNNKEYIEVLTEGEGLENYTIEDFGATDQLILKKESNSSYSLIVEEEFNYSKMNTFLSEHKNKLWEVGTTLDLFLQYISLFSKIYNYLF